MHVVVVARASRVFFWPVHCLTPEFLMLIERLFREYITVVSVLQDKRDCKGSYC